METTTLTRSKLVTREISETLTHSNFGTGHVAVHVNVSVTGVDPFKSDHYSLMSENNFKKAIAKIAKNKDDFAYRDCMEKANQAWQWFFVTDANLKKFSEFPKDGAFRNNAYEFVCETQDSLKTESDLAAYEKKLYTNALKKEGKNLAHFNHTNNTFSDIHNKLIPVPMYIDYGIRSSVYELRSAVEYLRTLKNVRMIDSRWGYIEDYPEIDTVPHYNADVKSETEVKLWVLPTQQQYDALRGGKEHILFGLEAAQKFGLFDLSPYKIKSND